ncbi:uncharacterized protein LOC125947111 [Dermacentor silvarum]|uniref:uncharacterized protein LOC125947111 n=1 Tax=Dermacentor silvarum TaxID=543639 RepID=UPI002101095B|nr:uncharacterized protein LOC125947111 [Dermacentor silvarum]
MHRFHEPFTTKCLGTIVLRLLCIWEGSRQPGSGTKTQQQFCWRFSAFQRPPWEESLSHLVFCCSPSWQPWLQMRTIVRTWDARTTSLASSANNGALAHASGTETLVGNC